MNLFIQFAQNHSYTAGTLTSTHLALSQREVLDTGATIKQQHLEEASQKTHGSLTPSRWNGNHAAAAASHNIFSGAATSSRGHKCGFLIILGSINMI